MTTFPEAVNGCPQFHCGPALSERPHTRDIPEFARRLRDQLISAVSRTGGHLGSNLGVVELTIALHRVFSSPRDRILFDTGHQTYVHKFITGRQEAFDGLRQQGGISGYPSRSESVHDIIENSHASTALSYADGLAKAQALKGETDRAIVAVIGDGALTGGMAWEALNNIGGAPHRPLIIVLNDNGRSYSPTVGGLAGHLASLRGAPGPGPLAIVFEQLGIGYLGPVDGHDVHDVEIALRTARGMRVPVVVHCVTTKGRGYQPAEQHDEDRFHASGPFDPTTGRLRARSSTSWTAVFGAELAALGAERSNIVAITAAMLHPTGLASFAEQFPNRTYDVGIAEQHAVTSAAGLAMGGMHPVVAVYSTFLNRAFDQVLLDVALHSLPVTFALDRAGVTGNDGASHNGVWDLSILQVVPGLRIAAPRDGARLRALLREAVAIETGPTVVRYPKGAPPVDVPAKGTIGGVDVMATAELPSVLIVAVGPMVGTALAASEVLAGQGIGVTVVDPRWVKPLDPTLVDIARDHRMVVVVEDNIGVGGVGDAMSRLLREQGAYTPVRNLAIPAEFLEHAKREQLLRAHGLTPRGIAASIADLLAGLPDPVFPAALVCELPNLVLSHIP